MKKSITIGMDMGDNNHSVTFLSWNGDVLEQKRIGISANTLRRTFKEYAGCTIAIEAGTHSPWVSRLLEDMGLNVLVGNPRKLRMIWQSDIKDDDRDSEMLARIARFDPNLLYPIYHRSEEAQADLEILKARDIASKARAKLVTHVRGVVKSMGSRIPKCSTECFHARAEADIPETLIDTLRPILKSIEQLTETIKGYDHEVKQICELKYPETIVLQQISGVGPITSLAFLLTVESSDRFKKSRDVGPFFGLTPKRSQSGQMDQQLHISKAGNSFVRSLLVGCAQYILGAFGPECNLRDAGMRIAARGGKNAKKRAVVAVARKLAVLMHKLWASNSEYEVFYKENKATKIAA